MRGAENWKGVPGGKHFLGGVTILDGPLRVAGLASSVRAEVEGSTVTLQVLDGVGEDLSGVTALWCYVADSETGEALATAELTATRGQVFGFGGGPAFAVTDSDGGLEVEVKAAEPRYLAVVTATGLVVSPETAPAVPTARSPAAATTKPAPSKLPSKRRRPKKEG